MPSRRATVALLVIGGLLLLTNPLWLYPDAGETHYTYERSAIVTEDGSITYDGIDHRRFREQNDLEPVGCQRHDREGERGCAFDQHLVDHPPVTVPREQLSAIVEPEFVHVRGDYYRRTHNPNGSGSNETVTHDVERVTPETVLAESAQNLTEISNTERGTVPLEFYVAVTGETVTSTERLDREDLGNVYRRNGSYYTVVATDRTLNDRGPPVLQYENPRRILMLVGIVLLVWAAQRVYIRRREQRP